ncbi:methyl-accepting chemotaxis protein [Haloarcula argentinensis]|uniref:Methyl-accepting chemotaxis protein n=1 Tax=Haloarcula argentinensis TaxID=43776 RepID=A0A830FMD1_HALAR|nr:methyl-accepting chemotaxis protein [Haloarcula argentinensis]MDS0254847.1 methyl-accepting chemotaxis protein [Haloarcula argentinensis]GGM38675.1 methyl-accepting chemotaxis protein [Haloarcula argentinensis]
MNLENHLPKAIRKSYTRKFALSALLILIVVGSIGGITQAQVSNDVTEQQQQNLLTNAEMEGDSLEQWLTTQQQNTRSLSEHRGFASNETSARETLLDREADLSADVTALHYIERESGTIIASTDSEVEGAGIQETSIVWPMETAYEDLSFNNADEVSRSWVYRDDDGKTAIAFISPVPNSDRAVVLVTHTSERAERFRNSINGTETVVVAAGTTDVVFGLNESALLSPYSARGSEEILSAIGQQSKGTVITPDSLVAFAPVGGGTDWVAVKRVPKSSALAIQQKVTTNVVALVGVSIGGLLLLGWLVNRGPIQSMRELTDQATAVARGNLDEPVTDAGRIDEVGQVRTAFRDIKAYLEVVADQADALSEQRFDADVLEEDVPGRLGESLDGMQADLEGFISDITEAREDAQQAQAEAEDLATSLERRAEEFGEVMGQAADGDLTQRLDEDTDTDAMGDIAEAFNDMVAELERTIVKIESFANNVDGSTEEISASAAEIKAASEQVSEAVQEIATGAENQNENILQVTDEMTDMSATIEEISSSADEVAMQSEEAAETAVAGRESGEKASEQMANIEQQTAATIEQVEELAEEVDRINEVVTFIDDIAEQTNMLALNANIEAARAGGGNDETDGEGFAVVANEVKQLAEETQEATDDISSIIADVQSVTDKTVTDMQEIGTQIEDGHTTVEEATDSLADIARQVESANDGVQSISDVTAEQATSSEEVVAMVEEVGSISEETTAESENAAASAEEQAASVTEVTNNIQGLSQQASDLRSLVEEFTTSEEVTTGEMGEQRFSNTDSP